MEEARNTKQQSKGAGNHNGTQSEHQTWHEAPCSDYEVKLPTDPFRTDEYKGIVSSPPLRVSTQDEVILWEQAMDAAIHPDDYTYEQLLTFRMFVGYFISRPHIDDAQWHRNMDEVSQALSSNPPTNWEKIKQLDAQVLSTTRGYLEARWADLLESTNERERLRRGEG